MTTSNLDTLMTGMSSQERDVMMTIMSQLADKGNSNILESLYYQDYDEIPVSIDEFLSNEKYMGLVYNRGENIYPFWKETLHNFFHNNTDRAFELLCLSGDTKIPLLNGTSVTIEELASSEIKDIYLYSYDLCKEEYVVGKIKKVWSNGVKPVYKITLDNGESVKLTSNHRLLTRDKHWKSIDSGLSVGDSLMPFNSKIDEWGYERIQQPQSDGSFREDLTHQMVARWKYGYQGSVPFGRAIHHKNFIKTDNNPQNLCKVEKKLHIKYHSKRQKAYLEKNHEYWYTRTCAGLFRYRKDNPDEMSKRVRAYWDSLNEEERSNKIHKLHSAPGIHDWKSTDRGIAIAQRNISQWNDKVKEVGSPEYILAREYALQGNRNRWSDEKEHLIAREKMIARNQNPEFQKKAREARNAKGYDEESKRIRFYNSNPDNQLKNRRNKCLSQLNKICSMEYTQYNYRELLESIGCKYKPSISFIEQEFGSFLNAMKLASVYNHKIISIDYIGEEEVFDMEIEGTHNFALSAGIVAHNCTGAIGVGKSTIASIALTYVIYRTLCLRDPQKYYGLTKNSPIVFVVMNLTLDLAYQGLYSLIVESIKLSPWFCERVDIRGKYDFSIEFPKGVALIAGSQTVHTIGKNVLGACMDEVNFSNAPKGSKNSVMDMYRNIRRRMESRFLKAGRLPGILMMVSSKNNELDFLEQYIQSVKHQKTTWVVDKAVYDIKPPETYTGEKFKVAVGDKTKSSRILTELEDEATAIEQGYTIIEVPIEYKVAFQQDINDALKDISGISSTSTNKLIPYSGKIDSCIDDSRNSPVAVDIIQMGLSSIEDIKDYLDDISSLKNDLHLPRFAHVDIGLKGDKLGLAIVHSDKQTHVERYTETGKVLDMVENSYYVDMLLSVQALPGSEIPLYKIREFFLWLKSAIHMKFQVITYDGFQSADSMQLLRTSGFDSRLLSVDRSDIPYLNLRSCILEKRINYYRNELLLQELYDLEYDRVKGKVDHPYVKADGSTPSKDLSDALCGAIHNAQTYYAEKKGNKPIHDINTRKALTTVQRLNNIRKSNTLDSNDNWILND